MNDESLLVAKAESTDSLQVRCGAIALRVAGSSLELGGVAVVQLCLRYAPAKLDGTFND